MKRVLRFVSTLAFLSGATPGMAQGLSFEELDTDKNGALSPAEFAALGGAGGLAAFSRWDDNGDGVLSKAEFDRERSATTSVTRFERRQGTVFRETAPPVFSGGPAADVSVARDGVPTASLPPMRPQTSAPVSGPNVPDRVRASRLFAGPQDYPPTDFAAYGIVAFRFAATDANRARYMAICEGFLAAIPAAADLEAQGVPLNEQMVTVWPVNDGPIAQRLNAAALAALSNSCAEATSAINLVTSLGAIAAAKLAHPDAEFDRDGPYLLAWSPASTKGNSDALVLVFDLSDVTTAEEAMRRFGDWAVEIESNPEAWCCGWDNTPFRIKLRQLADKYGDAVLKVLGSLGGD